MTSRYLGLVVVPGEYITKIEVEEFASQMKGKGLDTQTQEGLPT
jgi:N-alpha-acetyltransferase 38, NatC auxiliary subunit